MAAGIESQDTSRTPWFSLLTVSINWPKLEQGWSNLVKHIKHLLGLSLPCIFCEWVSFSIKTVVTNVYWQIALIQISGLLLLSYLFTYTRLVLSCRVTNPQIPAVTSFVAVWDTLVLSVFIPVFVFPSVPCELPADSPVYHRWAARDAPFKFNTKLCCFNFYPDGKTPSLRLAARWWTNVILYLCK